MASCKKLRTASGASLPHSSIYGQMYLAQRTYLYLALRCNDDSFAIRGGLQVSMAERELPHWCDHGQEGQDMPRSYTFPSAVPTGWTYKLLMLRVSFESYRALLPAYGV